MAISILELKNWLQQYPISNLCLDSRCVEVGDAFIVLAGATHNATQFIPQAIERGAAAILIEAQTAFTEDSTLHAELSLQVPYLIVPQLREKLSALADVWYQQPSQAIQLVGITGTNGKTSSAQWLAKGLQQLGQSAGTIGTLGCTGLPTPPKHEYTTPDVLSLHRWLRLFAESQVKTVALEVSSHALDQHRADDVHFHTAIFTNLSRDHLDYHESFEAYAEAKARLFTEHKVGHAVINIDDAWGRELVKRWKSQPIARPLLTVSLTDTAADLFAMVRDSQAGLELALQTPFGSGTVVLPHLNGRFNASNALGVLGAWLHLGLSWEQVLYLLPLIQPAPGRMNRLGGKAGAPTVIVDYAHTPDALEKVLLALHPLRETTGGKIWCIFGAGGDRDPGKRPIMGATAANYADYPVVTSDNPRSEEPAAIAADVYAGIPEAYHAVTRVEVDRRRAIAQTLEAAQPNDIVLIAGKGHEPYQEIKGVKTPFSDAEEVEKWLSSRLNANGLSLS